MSARHLPPPQNGDYRGPVLVHPARGTGGVDLAEIAARERRERWSRPAPEQHSSRWSRRAEWLAIAGILLALATIIVPGAAWLLSGAEQSPAAADALLEDEHRRVAP